MTYLMTCHSGGSVEVYIEPILPKPSILIFGRSHIGMALEKIAKAMSYQVSVVLAEVDRDAFPNADKVITNKEYKAEDFKNHYIVVCTQGEGDETSLHLALNTPSKYLAFVASRKKAHAVYTTLRSEGVTFEQLKHVKTPAGLDINAKLPEEVAISILAEMIQYYRNEDQVAMPSTEKEEATVPSDYYINPVCQVPVHKATAKHIIEHNGDKVYFCCDGCKVSFEKAPEKYITA
ncbi:MAG: XdhC family protein [Bacteroidota bacterium]